MMSINRLSKFTLIIFLLFSFSLFACHSDSKPISTTEPSSQKNAYYVQCKNPRPQYCTREYLPVCAKRDTGIRCVTTPCPSTREKTYSNACTACSDSKVYGYIPGGACN